jgi:lipoprotein Spr
LYQFINDWYGVKYKYGGKDKGGIDCSGLTSTLYSVVYKKTISCSTKDLVSEVKKIKESDLREGDLVFFNTNGKSISHVGVYLQNHKFVHASTKKGVMISDMNEPYFKKTYVSSGRVK